LGCRHASALDCNTIANNHIIKVAGRRLNREAHAITEGRCACNTANCSNDSSKHIGALLVGVFYLGFYMGFYCVVALLPNKA
jgi:hypothetical protein